MKFKLFHNRVLITVILLLVQIYWLFLLLIRLINYSTVISLMFTILSISIVLFLVKKDENANYKIAWIVLVMVLPLFGGLLYVFLGDKRPSKKMREKFNRQRSKMMNTMPSDKELLSKIEDENPRGIGTAKYISSQSKYSIYSNTQTKYYPLGENMFEDMLEALRNAKHFIFMEYFIVNEGKMWDSILSILEQKVKEGVEVRFVYDDVGSLFTLSQDYFLKLERKGIKCFAFNPFVPVMSLVMNNRDHRKILVVDGYIGFTGGINLADEYINEYSKYGHWKDTGVRLIGEGVWNLTHMFLEMWNSFRLEDSEYSKFMPHMYHTDDFVSDGYVQAFGDSPLDDESVSENVYLDIVNKANKYVYICTPYLVLDDHMKDSLCLAAKRGVDVRIVTPGIPDKKIVYRLTRSNYTPLLKAGVRIYEYAPGFLHAKSFVSDDCCGVVGTINLDYRSLYLHFENGVYMIDSSALADLKQDCLDTMEKSREIYKEFHIHGMISQLFDSILRLLSPLL